MSKKKFKINPGGQTNLSYLERRRAMKNKAAHGKEEKEAEKKEEKKSLGAFFNAQTLVAPSKCENCGKSLASTIQFHPRAHICHIVPKTKKGGCPSVATHPQNKFFGCLDCHTFYDQSVAEGEFYEVLQMPIIPIIRHRFLIFFPFIEPHERKNIPAFLLDKKGQPIDPKKENGTTKQIGKDSGRETAD